MDQELHVTNYFCSFQIQGHCFEKEHLRGRNEASDPHFSNTHVEKFHIIIDNASESLSQALPNAPPSFQSHDVDEALSDDLSSRPYDPVTNYLSPRPQFLRYKPKRRQELLLGLESGVGLSMSRRGCFDSQKSIDEEVGAVTTPSSLASPHRDGSLEKEDEEVELSDEENERSDEESDEEEYEVVEEEKGGKLKGVLKCLLLLLVIVLFASNMSPMNHQTHFEGVEDGYCGIQNSTIETSLLKKLESGDNLCDQTEERRTGFVEVIKGATEMEAEEVISQGEKTHIDKEIEDEAKVEDENLGDVELADEMREGVELQAEEIEGKKGRIDEFSDEEVISQGEKTHIDEEIEDEAKVEDENLGDVELADEMREVVELQAEKIEGKKGRIDEFSEVVLLQVEDTEEISDPMVENSELQGAGPSMSDFDHQCLVYDVSNAFEEEKLADNDDTGFDEVSDLKAEGNWKEELINFMKQKTFYTAAIGVSVFSVIVTSLASMFRFKRRNATKKDSSVIASPSTKPLVIEQKKINRNVSSPPSNPYSEPVIAERYNSVLPSRRGDNIEHVYSSFTRMSLSSKHSTGAASGEYFHSQAPTVDLLGELVVGEVSSSLRSCMKNKMIEGEESNYPVSSKKLGSKAQSVSIRAKPAVSEFSPMDLHSYGSFGTPQKVMNKKEGGQDGEVTTPLRRSSRLRNRTVTSP